MPFRPPPAARPKPRCPARRSILIDVVPLRRPSFSAAAGLLLLSLAAVLAAFTAPLPTPAGRAQAYYHGQLQALQTRLAVFRGVLYQADTTALRAHFAACRDTYKHLEFAVEYYYPHAAQRLNGAALPEAEPSEPDEPVPPAGFQVLEEYTFGTPDGRPTRDLMRQELDNLLAQATYLQQQEATLAFSEADVYEAVRLNLYRLAAKGLSGFDSPTARRSLPEAAATLQATADVAALLGAPAALATQLRRSQAAVSHPGQTFDGFDRAGFFTRYFNPLLAALHQAQEQQGVPFGATRRAVRPAAVSFFATDAFEAAFFAPADAAPATPAVLALGRALFQEPRLSGVAGRSCASCHVPARAYTDGLRANQSLLPGQLLARNTPTLRNVAWQPEQFYDGRVRFLEDQVHAVVSSAAEMGGHPDELPAQLRAVKPYPRLFAQAFPQTKQPLTEVNIRRALATYVRSLAGLTSRFDDYLRGDTTQLTPPEVLGFNLFMGKAQCGTCHYLPLFSGVVPPLYDKVESEVLGVPASADTLRATLDPDLGRYQLHHLPHQQHAFKTPSVRNASLTAPYMHNGVYQTLGEVIDFYDRGGGAGLGLAVPTQTLAPERLHLTPVEKQALVAFIGTLVDQPAAARP
ncbi:MAG: cytochrome C peroxidase [Hymenobacter sp.]|nr:MAG: cytochrome C peroxidase [Hymenobacter sp.]